MSNHASRDEEFIQDLSGGPQSRQTQRRGHMKTGAETETRWPQAWDHVGPQQLEEAGRFQSCADRLLLFSAPGCGVR